MATKKQVFKVGDDTDPFVEARLRDLPRDANGLYNMHFDKWGRIVKRAGYAKYNTAELTGEAGGGGAT